VISKTNDSMNLQNSRNLYGKQLGATDGEIGSIEDFYFDDQTWEVRYVVANTGTWLTGRQVLLPPHAFPDRAFGARTEDPDVLSVNLTKKQIEESPSIDEHQPVSRQYEEEYYRYYGWPAYWGGGGIGGIGAFPVVIPPPAVEVVNPDDVEPHLRSMREVEGYHVKTKDGESGAVRGFMVTVDSWRIERIEVESGHWFSGKTCYILPKHIINISYPESSVFVDLSKEEIQQAEKEEVV
jgi:uncharacterized protein YrrD